MERHKRGDAVAEAKWCLDHLKYLHRIIKPIARAVCMASPHGKEYGFNEKWCDDMVEALRDAIERAETVPNGDVDSQWDVG